MKWLLCWSNLSLKKKLQFSGQPPEPPPNIFGYTHNCTSQGRDNSIKYKFAVIIIILGVLRWLYYLWRGTCLFSFQLLDSTRARREPSCRRRKENGGDLGALGISLPFRGAQEHQVPDVFRRNVTRANRTNCQALPNVTFTETGKYQSKPARERKYLKMWRKFLKRCSLKNMITAEWYSFKDQLWSQERHIIIWFGGRSGIIWILIFMIPAVFASMIHDSYKNFLPDSLFTKTIDHLLT